VHVAFRSCLELVFFSEKLAIPEQWICSKDCVVLGDLLAASSSGLSFSA